MYSMSPSESDFAANDMYTHIRTHSVRPSTAGSQTHSIAPFQLPGPSGIVTGGQPSEHQVTSAGAEVKAREARMDRARLHAVNITEGVEVDPEHPSSVLIAPPPVYSREAQ